MAKNIQRSIALKQEIVEEFYKAKLSGNPPIKDLLARYGMRNPSSLYNILRQAEHGFCSNETRGRKRSPRATSQQLQEFIDVYVKQLTGVAQVPSTNYEKCLVIHYYVNDFPVVFMAEALGLNRFTYYAWVRRTFPEDDNPNPLPEPSYDPQIRLLEDKVINRLLMRKRKLPLSHYFGVDGKLYPRDDEKEAVKAKAAKLKDKSAANNAQHHLTDATAKA